MVTLSMLGFLVVVVYNHSYTSLALNVRRTSSHSNVRKSPLDDPSKNVPIRRWMGYRVVEVRIHKSVPFTCVYKCFSERILTSIVETNITDL